MTTRKWKECDALGNVLLGNHVYVNLTRATYLNIVEESFMTMVFPGGSGLFQQDNDPGLQIPQVSSEPQQV